MIINGTKLKVIDNTGVLKVRCIRLLNSTQVGKLGDYAIVSIMRYNTKKGLLRDKRKRKLLSKGILHRALIIRIKNWFKRLNGIYFFFNENAVILVNKKNRPLGSKIKGPLLREFKKWNINICSMCDDLI